MTDAVLFRPHKESDLNFIQSSWARSYYSGTDYDKGPVYYKRKDRKLHAQDFNSYRDENCKEYLTPDQFNEEHRPIREQVLSNPNVAIIIACSQKDEDLIIGWAAVEKAKRKGLILHYIYVKQAFKGEGIFQSLLKKALPSLPVQVTHITDKFRKIAKKNPDLFKEFYLSSDAVMVRNRFINALPKVKDES